MDLKSGSNILYLLLKSYLIIQKCAKRELSGMASSDVGQEIFPENFIFFRKISEIFLW